MQFYDINKNQTSNQKNHLVGLKHTFLHFLRSGSVLPLGLSRVVFKWSFREVHKVGLIQKILLCFSDITMETFEQIENNFFCMTLQIHIRCSKRKNLLPVLVKNARRSGSQEINVKKKKIANSNAQSIAPKQFTPLGAETICSQYSNNKNICKLFYCAGTV